MPFLILVGLILLSIFSLKIAPLNQIEAAPAPCPLTPLLASPRAEGLITATGNITGLDNPQGNCITGAESLVPLEKAKVIQIETYDDFKNIFFTKTKHTNEKVEVDTWDLGDRVVFQFNSNHLYGMNGKSDDLIIDSLNNIPANLKGVQVFFVDGNLYIKDDINYNDKKTSGLVFVVKGDINIDAPDIIAPVDTLGVTQINAVLISFGTICTGYSPLEQLSPCTQNEQITTTPLTINGSLISLGDKKIIFRRSRINNKEGAAEIINAQPKYLYLLKDLLSDDLLIPNNKR